MSMEIKFTYTEEDGWETYVDSPNPVTKEQLIVLSALCPSFYDLFYNTP